MNHFRDLADIRRDYGELSLTEEALQQDPMAQFARWFEEVLQHEHYDPTAMVLSTVDTQGYPDSRVVLLKGVQADHFVFYSNYHSKKAEQIAHQPHGALNFYWPHMARQVRVRGVIEKIAADDSDKYFYSRPFKSQLSAIISPQSKTIDNRAVLEKALNDLIAAQGETAARRPAHWGGYRLLPSDMEFWQGRDNRLHDRIQYYHQNQAWKHRRLAP